MFAIVAAILFAIALIMDLAEADIGISAGVFVTAGLLCLALHMAGIGAAWRSRSGRWSMRR
ncbi:MAG TPA: hypothetical protein VGX25_13820 [Actinophytocola sp.]|uniref:hypothetical protein n=1 Tax=Actinophytocola sp. TaxID=1872138 RepID=UPI002DDD2828|nr:hypothetical protein [Actinophytocola sp.]HEV2780463.1 hypothetical protein [Actinophytocola sp.]